MRVVVLPTVEAANRAAADYLEEALAAPRACNLMVAGGNTSLALYARMAERRLPLAHVRVFVLDEYVGVPADDPRTCANTLRRAVVDAWGVPPAQFHTICPEPAEAEASVRAHAELIQQLGGLDALVLGLGTNGHLGFNEPGSGSEAEARVVALEPESVEANRRWFGGDYAPDRGATVGLKTILAARRVLVLAYGAHKVRAVRAMVEGPVGPQCPASFLQRHPEARLFLDPPAAASLRRPN